MSAQELRSRISEIDQFLKNTNAFDRLREENLDETLRREFFAAIETKQILFRQLIDEELKDVDEILAGHP